MIVQRFQHFHSVYVISSDIYVVKWKQVLPSFYRCRNIDQNSFNKMPAGKQLFVEAALEPRSPNLVFLNLGGTFAFTCGIKKINT